MRYVITGGPGSGKSSLLRELSVGNHSNFVPEIARDLFKILNKYEPEKLKDRAFVQNYIETTHIKNWVENPFGIFDRGLPDEIGYRKFFGEPISENLKKNCRNLRYDKVFFLPFWEEIFINDEQRKETLEQAKTLEMLISLAYEDVGYELIIVPKISVYDRVSFVNDAIHD
jgi:predicted ATPase